MPKDEHIVEETDGDPNTVYEDTKAHESYGLGAVAETKLDASIPSDESYGQASLEGPTNG